MGRREERGREARKGEEGRRGEKRSEVTRREEKRAKREKRREEKRRERSGQRRAEQTIESIEMEAICWKKSDRIAPPPLSHWRAHGPPPHLCSGTATPPAGLVSSQSVGNLAPPPHLRPGVGLVSSQSIGNLAGTTDRAIIAVAARRYYCKNSQQANSYLYCPRV